MKEDIKAIKRALQEHQIDSSTAAKLLTESSYEWTNGSKVYVAHGIHAGSNGVVKGEVNGAYASVSVQDGRGLIQVPRLFLLPWTQ